MRAMSIQNKILLYLDYLNESLSIDISCPRGCQTLWIPVFVQIVSLILFLSSFSLRFISGILSFLFLIFARMISVRFLFSISFYNMRFFLCILIEICQWHFLFHFFFARVLRFGRSRPGGLK